MQFSKWEWFCCALAGVLLTAAAIAAKSYRKAHQRAPVTLAALTGAAPASYRVVTAGPNVTVCTAPLGGILIDTPNMAGQIGGVCLSNVIFANGFES